MKVIDTILKPLITIFLVCSMIMCGCTIEEDEEDTKETTRETAEQTEGTENTKATQPSFILPEPTDESTEPTEIPTEPIADIHSDLYLEGCSQELMMSYFSEVVLDVEYNLGSGNPSLVQKWTVPLYYRVYGYPTQEDLAVINEMAALLNDIQGFPGMYPADENTQETLSINFLPVDDFNAAFSDVVNGEYAFGAAQFWYYIDTNEIYEGRIGCLSDISQIERNSIILEEIYNVLGLNDTLLREDSIVYQYSNENLSLSPEDLIILRLLYNPAIRCGMNEEACFSEIEELYY